MKVHQMKKHHHEQKIEHKEVPKARAFEPRACCACEAIRPKNKNYSYVYHTKQRVRYCKCSFCGATWTQFS